VTCGGFAGGGRVIRGVPAKKGMPRLYFVQQHPSREIRNQTGMAPKTRYIAAMPHRFSWFGSRRLVICTIGLVTMSAGDELSEEDTVFSRGHGRHEQRTETRDMRWKFSHVRRQ
jgi:hypothetical protein